jgi:hypothetical protein
MNSLKVATEKSGQKSVRPLKSKPSPSQLARSSKKKDGLLTDQNELAMNLKPIKTKKDYEQALNRLEVIFDAKKGTNEGDELEILGILIDQYENEHFPIWQYDEHDRK